MTGQLISGTPMKDAVMYQQIIMFMISASTALGVLNAVVVSSFIFFFSDQISNYSSLDLCYGFDR